MRPSSRLSAKLAACAAVASFGLCGVARAQSAAAAHDLPQSLIYEHEQTLADLETLTHHPGAVGVEAAKALELFKQHIAHEQEYILPPLTLLPDIADGKATPDMAWAMAMTDRVRSEHERIFAEHAAVTDRMNALYVAALQAHDQVATDFAKSASADSLNDLEILEPTILLIGEFLHSKLDAKP